jgi:DNA-binding PadR family transcriptional regulator
VAATEARLMVLATVLHLQPATGYAVRKHLLAQGVEAWGEMSVASIYSVLRTLTRHGHLEEIADPTGVRASTRAFRITDQGRREFHALWLRSIEVIDPARPLAFHVAITLTALVPRRDYVAALGCRLQQLDQRLAAAPAGLEPATANAVELWRALAEAEAQWIRETLRLADDVTNPLRLTFDA